MILDRSDQIWEYRDRRDRFVIAWVHAPVDEMGHAVTVFFSTEPGIWGLGVAALGRVSARPLGRRRIFRPSSLRVHSSLETW